MYDNTATVSVMMPRDAPPMPVLYDVTATLRNDQPVARVQMVDITGDGREVDMSPELAFKLAMDLLAFCRQVLT